MTILTSPPFTKVQLDEVLIVVMVLLVWAGAVFTFFNQWGRCQKSLALSETLLFVYPISYLAEALVLYLSFAKIKGCVIVVWLLGGLGRLSERSNEQQYTYLCPFCQCDASLYNEAKNMYVLT